MNKSEPTDKILILDENTTPEDILRSIAQSGVEENAFLVMDVRDIIKKHLKWKSTMPRVTPFYAVKCNHAKMVLQVLAALGTGFDCSTDAEIARCLEVGADDSRIIFAHPTKMPSHIRYAAAHNVNTMTFDNEGELYKVKELHPNARMVLRIRSDAAKAEVMFGKKFGCDVTSEAPHLLKLALELGVNIVGVCFHVGSGCLEPESFRRAIAAAREVFDLATDLGYNMELLDIGGGFPGDSNSSVDEFAEVINTALDDFFPLAEMEDVQIIAEPGAFYVASAFTLATQIHSKRDTMYYITDGLYGCLRWANYFENSFVKPVVIKSKPGKLQHSTLWGPTCDSTDVVAEDVMLPPLDVGDWLLFRDMGAYTLASASNFSGLPIPKVYAVINKSMWCSLKNHPPLTEDHFTFYHNWGIV